MVSVKDKDIQRIIDLLKKNQIGELEVHDGKQVIKVCSSASGGAQLMAPVHPSISTTEIPNISKAKAGRSIKAPLVGTVYLAPSPDAAAFVKVGQTVNKGQVVCLVEAMKTFNHVKSTEAGVIKEICVEDGHAVEFDQPLFVIDDA